MKNKLSTFIFAKMTMHDVRVAMLVFAYFIGIGILNYQSSQHTFHWIIIGYSLAFASYAILVKSEISAKGNFCIMAFALTLSTLSFPRLSDDVYRFLWDGELLCREINPYTYLPKEILAMKVNQVFDHLYPKLNSSIYYSVYPLTCQLIFCFGTLLSKLGLSPVVCIKIIYILVHLIGFYYAKKTLIKFKIEPTRLYLYYLNPLVIIEGIGNMHAEVVMVGLTAVAMYYVLQHKWLIAAVMYSLAIATKMTVLMLLPFLFFYLYNEGKLKFIFYCTIFTTLLFLPLLLDKGILGFSSSLDLYFRKFEFNASLYYLLRYLGQILTGYNQIAYIGPLLGLVALYVILKTSLDKSYWPLTISNFSKVSIIILTIHLLCSTTVHPWYLITILFFASIIEIYSLVLWSYLITLTYIHYNGSAFIENYWLVAIEYIGVIYVLFRFDGHNFNLKWSSMAMIKK